MLRAAPIVPLSRRVHRPEVPNRPSFEFRIDRAGAVHEVFYIEGRVLNGAMMPGSSGILRVHGEAHGLVVLNAVLGLHGQALNGTVILRVQRPAFDLASIEAGTVFASHAHALAA